MDIAIEQRNRTPLQAYQHVLNCLEDGTVDPEFAARNGIGCRYETEVPFGIKMCGVGCLLSQEQRDAIFRDGANGYGINAASAAAGGVQEIIRTTGLSISELCLLQSAHDTEVKAYENRARNKSNIPVTGTLRRYLESKVAELKEQHGTD